MVKGKEETPYGYIYKSLNTINEKVYIGKTGKTIEERWNRHLEDARALKRAREANPDKRIKGTHLDNAINKYGSDAFIVNQEDVAYSREELNEKERYWVKEYDSMNPDKGYNMTEGGEGGRQRPEVIEKMTEISRERAKDPEWRKRVSEAGTKKWQEKEYREKQTKERQERAKGPDWLKKTTEINRARAKDSDWVKKMTEINQKIARNPQSQEKMSKALSEKWQESKYQESVSKGVTEKWKDEKYRERQVRAKAEGKREIPDKAEFLKDITEMNKKDINTKYDMDGKSINKRIEEMLKHQGVRTYSEAKNYLHDKNLNEVLKDIEKRQEMTKKPDFKEKMREIGKQYRKEIPDKREFLNEIKGDMLKKDMLKEYDMGKNSFNKRIQDMFGPDGPKNYTELKDYMQERNVNDVLKEIEERDKQKEVKPKSEGEDLKDKGESKSQDNSKEKTDKDTKSDEKEDLKEKSKEENEDNKSDKNKENSERNQNQENSDENLREKGEKSAEIEENIESKNKETMDEDTSEEEKENNVSDSEESKSKDSSNSEEEAKSGKNVEDMENLNLTVKDYAGIDKNFSERAQDITCLDENQDSKNSGSTKYIDLGNDDIKSIVVVKDIKTDENKDYKDIEKGGKKELPDYAFIDNYLDKTKEIEESKSDKGNERGKEYRHT